MFQFTNLANLYHNETRGDFSIDVFEICDGDVMAMVEGIPKGRYVRLLDKRGCVMSTTPMEMRTNMGFLWNAHGDVLIGGLGIGMIILAAQERQDVKSITVIEKFQDCIDLVTSQVPFNEKVKIICADVFDWKPDGGQKFDCIYMDVWSYVNSDVYKEMCHLTRRYGKFLKPKEESPNRYNDCWAKWYAKNNRPPR